MLEVSEEASAETIEINEQIDEVKGSIEEQNSIFDIIFEEDDRVFHASLDIDTSKDVWEYGITPCEWVYIEPNIQLQIIDQIGFCK